jgi:hypothetical protein
VELIVAGCCLLRDILFTGEIQAEGVTASAAMFGEIFCLRILLLSLQKTGVTRMGRRRVQVGYRWESQKERNH